MLKQRELMSMVSWACAGCGDETRRIYNTVSVDVAENGLATAVASNGHRLAAVSGFVEDASPGLFDARTMLRNQARQPAPYPTWRQIMPTHEPSFTLLLSPSAVLPDLALAVLGRRWFQQCGEFCAGGFGLPSNARMRVAGDAMAVDFEDGPPLRLRLPLASEVGTIAFSASPLYLLEALAAIRAAGWARARLEVRSLGEPLVLRGSAPRAPDTPEIVCLIMRVRDERDEREG